MTVLERLLENDPEASYLTIDGYDDCIIGIATRFGMDPVLAYDREAMIQKMIREDGLDREGAEEHFDFNIIGAWMGDSTPVFVENFRE